MTSSELRQDKSGAITPEQRFFVYFNAGDVRSVGPATSMHLTDDEVVILDGDVRVSGFPRRDVYFCSGELVAPPFLT
jgi:hypothetical protein